MTHRRLAALAAASLVFTSLSVSAASADPSARQERPATGSASLRSAPDMLEAPRRGETAIRQLGDQLSTAAARNDLSASGLRSLLREDRTAWVDTDGLVHFVDPAREATDDAPAASHTPLAPLAETFQLHSNPGADLTILLDFDGAYVANTAWNANYGVTAASHPAWDPAGDGPAFSDSERRRVQDVWAIVAEDYASFDVDVTTEYPGGAGLVRSTSTDATYGTRVLVTPSNDAFAKICSSTCGGVAYIGVFDRVGSYTQPAWVFPQGTGNAAKGVAEAASHEAGHNLGLQHHGTSSQGYYAGHGSWAPIMGVGYDRPLAQWSRGSYPGANNVAQDDVAVLGGYLGTRLDETPGGVGAASPLPTGEALIGSAADVDAYTLGSCQSGSVVDVRPAAYAPNLDVRAVLHDSGGQVLATSQPPSGFGDGVTATGVGGSLTVPATGDGYVVSVEGVGEGGWTTGGYDDYGSVGAYAISAPGCLAPAVDGVPTAPLDPAMEDATLGSLTLGWAEPAVAGSSPITGYLVARTGSTRSWTLSATSRSHTFTGLAADTSYELSVRALNGAGAGPATTVTASTLAPPPEVPSAPRNLTGSYDVTTGTIGVWWAESVSSGTQPIAGYAVYLDGVLLGQVDGTSRGATIRRQSGFAEGTYLVEVAAVSSVGESPRTPLSVAVDFPDATAPAPPSGVAARSRDSSASISWSPPADGGSPITGYTVIARADGEAERTVAVPAGGLGVLLTGLRNGSTYDVTVTASNAVGTSAESSPVTVIPGVADTVAPTASEHASDLRRVDPFFASDTVTVRVRLKDDRGIEGTPIVHTAPDAAGTWYDWNTQRYLSSHSAPLSLWRGDRRDGIWTARVRISQSAPEGGWSAWVEASDAWGNATNDPRATHSVFTVVSGMFDVQLPSAPTQVKGLPGSGRARVTWTPPAEPVSDFTVWVSPGATSVTVDSSRSSTVIDGLRDGVDYTFTVVAGNDYGESSESSPSAVTLPGTPPAPVSVTATPGDARAVVAWKSAFMPEDATYTVTSSPGGRTCSVSGALTCSPPGLTNGVPYTFKVSATSPVGTSPASAPSNSVVPGAVPDAPALVRVAGRDEAVALTWTKPAAHGAPVTGYTITTSPGGATTTVSGGDVLGGTVSELTNGTPYTFAVTATNSFGTSSTSGWSEPVIPSGSPPRMKAPAVKVSGANALVKWRAARSHGSPITRYRVDVSAGKDKTLSAAARKTLLKRLKPGRYTVRIRALNANGWSPYTSRATFRVR